MKTISFTAAADPLETASYAIHLATARPDTAANGAVKLR